MGKIVEHIKKNRVEDEIPVRLSISSVAGLSRIDNLEDETLFEVSAVAAVDPNDPDNNKYSSRAVSWKTIMSKLQETSANNFDQMYKEVRFGDLNWSHLFDDLDAPQGMDVKDAATVYLYLVTNSSPRSGEYHWAVLPENSPWRLPDRQNYGVPCVWGDVWTLANGEAVLSQWVDDVDKRVSVMERTRLAFSGNMSFSTVLSSYQTDNGELNTPKNEDGTPVVVTEPISRQYANPRSGVHSDGFVLAFWKQNKTSSSFTCPATGMLTLYGWLDSSTVQNVKYLPSAWCALEGNIGGRWEILQLQSVIPAKQFSYVSFCVPVIRGLEVRLELGFVPGDASGRYDRDKIPESLANTQPNAFLGGVYSPLA